MYDPAQFAYDAATFWPRWFDSYWRGEFFYPHHLRAGTTYFDQIVDPAEARAEDIDYLFKIHPGGFRMRDPDAPACSTWISPDSVTLKR